MAESSVEMDRLGTVLGSRYVLEERLGLGAMGVVYRARHLRVGRTFAIKVLHRELLANPGLVERFEQEALVAGRLQHRNVVRVVDFGETEDGTRYTVMDLVPGKPLSALMGAPVAAERVISLVMQLLDGLQHAHEVGLIHRDFKPDNVIVERGDDGHESPRIVDFGIAILQQHASSYEARGRLTTMGVVLGTPEYMAPEQARGEVMDHRADLFALGITCYQLLTGKLPFEGSGVEVAIENMTNDTPAMGVRVPCVQVDPLLEAFTRKLARKNPRDRPATASAARALLELISTDRAAAAIELGLAPRPRPAVANDPQRTIPLRVHADPQQTVPLKIHPIAVPEPVPPVAVSVFIGTGTRPARHLRIAGLCTMLVALALSLVKAEAGSPRPASIDLLYPDSVSTAAPQVRFSSATETPRSPPAPGLTVPAKRRQHEPAPAAVVPIVAVKAAPIPPAPLPMPVAPFGAVGAVVDSSPVAVASLYKQLGMELAALGRMHGSSATDDLWVRYRRVRFQATIATEASRARGAHIMLAIQRETALRAER